MMTSDPLSILQEMAFQSGYELRHAYVLVKGEQSIWFDDLNSLRHALDLLSESPYRHLVGDSSTKTTSVSTIQ
jgi:hypothetical protein